jgi:hypothetical protein
MEVFAASPLGLAYHPFIIKMDFIFVGKQPLDFLELTLELPSMA